MKIAIVNDVLMAVEAMRRIVIAGGEHEVAWIASDGAEAVERCATNTPDLILMDLIMPRMDGIEATRRIMAESPCAIVIVTADVGRNSPQVFEAMGAGALDAVDTPVLEHPNASSDSSALLRKIETIRRLIGGGASKGPPWTGDTPPPLRPPDHLVVIGASAGGPAALAKILKNLDQDFPAPIVIVQHVDAQFAEGLAVWLNGQTQLNVRIAQEGDRPATGTVLIAGGENHLVFSGPTRLSYTDEPSDIPYRPSIDIFFRSASRFWTGDVTGVLLTGMGRDGAHGLKTLKQHGHHTIAQDRRTSAVYGMPGAAAEMQAATEILALDKIAPRLTNIVAKTARTNG